jgi:hypothetical protein
MMAGFFFGYGVVNQYFDTFHGHNSTLFGG